MNENITIGVSIIVGPGRSKQLSRLLDQVSKFDQVVVVDNSPKREVEKDVISRGGPFEYYHVPWRRSPYKGKKMIYGKDEWGFSYQRNQALQKMKTTHMLWLDTDDLIGSTGEGREYIATETAAYHAFKKIAQEAPEHVNVWMINYVYSRDESNNANVLHSRERMVKLDADSNWKWVYPIHECLAPDQKPRPSFVEDVQVIHFPELADTESAAERNMNMLTIWHDQLETLGETKGDIQRARLYIGDTFYSLEKYQDCANWLLHNFLRKHPESIDLEKWHAWCWIAKSQQQLSNLEAAKAAALAAIDLEPGYMDGYVLLAQTKLMLEEDPQDILQLIEFAGTVQHPPDYVIKNPLDYTFTPFCIASDCKYDLGQWDEALRFALLAQKVSPHDERAEMLRAQAAQAVRKRDAVLAAKALYQMYLDYDENEKAAKLYELLPYVAQQDSDIVTLANTAHSRVRHMFNRDDYVKFYENNPHWTPVPEEYYEDDRIPSRQRYLWTLSRLKKALPNGGRILDVGCSDGFHSLNFAKHGYEVVGVDLDSRCVAVANERAEKFGLSAKFIHAFFEELDPSKVSDPFDLERNWFHNFDAVICGEVIEHVQDPAMLLGSLGDCAKDGAPILITTPDEAYDKGEVPGGGGSHNKEEEMTGHVRIFTQTTFEAVLKSNPEFHVVESHFVSTGDIAYRENQGWQVGEIRRMFRPEGPVIRIFCGANADFSPEDINTGGVGGSETAVVHMAKNWANMGCQVVVYGTACGIWDGVFYRPAEQYSLENHHSHIFISWRMPDLFKEMRPNADVTVLWMHDLTYPIHIPGFKPNEYPKEWVDRIDKIAVLSKFHRDVIARLHPSLKEKLWITRNGIDATRFIGKNIEKIPHRYVYTSSYDRGLEELLEMWPSIKKAIPDGELHVAYGSSVAEEVFRITGRTDKLNNLYRLQGKMKSMENLGIIHHDRIGQQELADLQLSSEVWLYPFQPTHESQAGGFLETYCITALEMQAARCIPFTRLNGALPEVVKFSKEWGPNVDPIPFLKNTESFDKAQLDANQKWALSQTWEALAIDWIKALVPQKELVEVK